MNYYIYRESRLEILTTSQKERGYTSSHGMESDFYDQQHVRDITRKEVWGYSITIHSDVIILFP
jgi:hypothetical protein